MNIEGEMILIIRLNGIEDFMVRRKKGRGWMVKGEGMGKGGRKCVYCVYTVLQTRVLRVIGTITTLLLSSIIFKIM